MAKKRVVKKSAFIVFGEGAAEKAFLYHLKNIYNIRENNKKVNINSGDGGSPEQIVRDAVKKSKGIDYDEKYIFMDSDCQVSSSALKIAKKEKFKIIYSEPKCLECLLLKVLDYSIPTIYGCSNCKKILHPLLSGKETDKNSYKKLFTKKILDDTNEQSIIDLILIMK